MWYNGLTIGLGGRGRGRERESHADTLPSRLIEESQIQLSFSDVTIDNGNNESPKSVIWRFKFVEIVLFISD